MNENREDASESGKAGYGKPPVGSRFKKGQSGNPKGRPKAEPLNDVQMFHEILNEPIAVKVGGKVRTIPAKIAMLRMMIHDGLRGSARDRMAVYTAMKKIRIFSLDADYERTMREEHEHAMAFHRAAKEMWDENYLCMLVGMGVELNSRQKVAYAAFQEKLTRIQEEEPCDSDGDDEEFDTSPDPEDDD